MLDNFERAMKAAAEHDEKLLTDGVEIVYNQLRDILGSGLCEIDANGAAFDPNQHEAVMPAPVTTMKTVVGTEKGYQLDDKVLRPASHRLNCQNRATEKVRNVD